MYRLAQNISLKDYNTFGIAVNAKYFLSIDSSDDAIDFFSSNRDFLKEERLILGGGSNLLFTTEFNGLIVYPDVKGIKLLSETDKIVELEVGAGEIWDDFVAKCGEKGWGGTENLSLIPGNIGAVPVQNIGAYGVEAESIIICVNGINLDNLEKQNIAGSECQFEYRNSIFKTQLKGKFVVTSVVFRLLKNPAYVLTYGALKNELSKYEQVNLHTVRSAVISIRESKLPDPKKIGNAGSFFKNPVVYEEVAQKIENQYHGVPLYAASNGRVKIAAGWLIEKCGWKGKSFGNAAVYDKQALIIVNNGNATGKEIYDLSEKIRSDVFSKFGIELDPEVNVIGEKKKAPNEIIL